MLTGDSLASAKHIADQAGIKEYSYSLLPHQKAEYVDDLKKDVEW